MSYMIGTWAEIPSPYVTDIMSKAGFDFTIVDMEHGIIDFETAQNMFFAARANHKKMFIRVPEIEESWILRCLDMGVDGIIFPGIETAEDVRKAVQLSRFRPAGSRGFNPYTSFGSYGAVGSDFLSAENKRVELGIIIESKAAVDKIDEILECDEIGLVYIGQYDLSVSMGIPGETANPDILRILDEVIKKIKAKGKKAGCMVHSVDECLATIGQGYEFIVYKVDTGILAGTIRDFTDGIRSMTHE